VTGGFKEGVLPVDKPVGPTSHDVVAEARRALRVRRIGHTGTLDPLASGLLLLCVGAATRLAEFLSGMDKIYEATALLGATTDTEDLESEVVARTDAWRDVTEAQVREALTGFTGEILQVPSRFSAKKVGGIAAHRLVRQGEDVELPPKRVTVHSLELVAFEAPEVRFRVRCSSGTFIRSLARDLGESLEVGAHLTALRRTAVGGFGVEGALALSDLADPDRVAQRGLTPIQALADLPRVDLDDVGARDVGHGRAVPAALADGGPVVACVGGTLFAVGSVRDGHFRPRKVLQHA
jgi:tRNA pseudouridine55 synthase